MDELLEEIQEASLEVRKKLQDHWLRNGKERSAPTFFCPKTADWICVLCGGRIRNLQRYMRLEREKAHVVCVQALVGAAEREELDFEEDC